jgi:hypothetical protein
MNRKKLDLEFINVREISDRSWIASVESMWSQYVPGMKEGEARSRIDQSIYIIKTAESKVVGISTAYKTYIQQLRNYLYAFRCFIAPDHRVPGLTSSLLVRTRDYLEEIHLQDGPEYERCIGLITLVENDRIMEHRREAIWPASKMVYIGNSANGKHIRVYYFN